MTVCCNMRLVLVEPPTVEPLTAAEARARQNIGVAVSDAVIEVFITAARQHLDGADGWLGRALITQTWRGKADAFPTCDGGRIYIPLPPLQEVSEISYLDSNGDPVTLVEGTDYQVVQAQRPYIIPLTSWPTATGFDGVTIEFVAGYGDDGENVPEPIRTAISLGVGFLCTASARDMSITEEVVEGVGSTRYVVSENAGKVIENTAHNLLSTYRLMYI